MPALLCLCGAVGLAMRRLVRTVRLIPAGDANSHTMLATWIAIGVAILVDGLVSGLIVMPASQLLIALYLGCAAGWCMSFNPAGRSQRNSEKALSGAVASYLSATVWLATGQ